MQRRFVAMGAGTLLGLAVFTCACFAQQTLGEKVGEGLQNVGRGMKRGVQEVGDVVRRQFETVKSEVNRMGVHSRVYSRLHWERSLHDSKFEVHMLRDGTVLLRGTVPDSESRERAVEIARNTVGITAVIDELNPLVVTEEVKVPTTSRSSKRSTR
ncbi:BON domain-containing protein [Singulisphaera sp. PoT]|uniref:BON domain-containing protein n=1 Tax=Singulisphaera sp. PoT TaxID=3411797 RepID=UPI003BF48C6B